MALTVGERSEVVRGAREARENTCRTMAETEIARRAAREQLELSVNALDSELAKCRRFSIKAKSFDDFEIALVALAILGCIASVVSYILAFYLIGGVCAVLTLVVVSFLFDQRETKQAAFRKEKKELLNRMNEVIERACEYNETEKNIQEQMVDSLTRLEGYSRQLDALLVKPQSCEARVDPLSRTPMDRPEKPAPRDPLFERLERILNESMTFIWRPRKRSPR